MTDSTNIPDRRAKQNWMVVWTGKLAPAIAASIGSYVMTQLSLSGTNFAFLGIDSEEVKGAIVFALTILFVEPMAYVNIACMVIEAVRGFVDTALHKIKDALTKPIQPENDQ